MISKKKKTKKEEKICSIMLNILLSFPFWVLEEYKKSAHFHTAITTENKFQYVHRRQVQ